MHNFLSHFLKLPPQTQTFKINIPVIYLKFLFVVVDDFASNIEKAIANVLKKERPNMNEDDKEDDKRQTRKRKKREKERRRNEKQRRLDSPKGEKDENEPLRGTSPEKSTDQHSQQQQQHSPHSSHDNDDSNESEYSSDNGREKKHYQRGPKSKNKERHDRKYNSRERSRERRVDTQLKDSPSVCLFYLQGKCNKVRQYKEIFRCFCKKLKISFEAFILLKSNFLIAL